jgi:hypothetical protein
MLVSRDLLWFHEVRSDRPMIDRVLAEAVVVVHLAFIAFVAIGGLLAWRWPKLLWAHVPAVVWSAGIVTIGYSCPLTTLEDDLRSRAGEHVYPGGFVARHLDNVVYPDRFKAFARLVVGLLVIIGWIGGAILRRRRHRGVSPPRTKAGFASEGLGGRPVVQRRVPQPGRDPPVRRVRHTRKSGTNSRRWRRRARPTCCSTPSPVTPNGQRHSPTSSASQRPENSEDETSFFRATGPRG